MATISQQIERAVQKFREDLLPRLPMVCSGSRDAAILNQRLAELERLHEESLNPPVFSVRFLGDTQNGKSTLINVLLGRKVLPEGHVGACSATIVRCRFKAQAKITVTFRYSSESQFLEDLAVKAEDSEVAIAEEESPAKAREVVCSFLGRFIKLLQLDVECMEDPAEIIQSCRELALEFDERVLLGTVETVEVAPDTEERIKENLSARGRRAFIVDECLIEGDFPDWHPSMELVDMPGTNAFNPWDDQVNTRLKDKVGGLAIVTKETQLHQTLMDWFKDSSILPEVAGSSERNQVRVFVIKTFIDHLDLEKHAAEDNERSKWEQTRAYCTEIEAHLRKQMLDLIGQRFVAENEVRVLRAFVERMPCHFVSPKIYRSLADPGLRKRVEKDPMKHLDLAAAFQRFDMDAMNTGIPGLKEGLRIQTGEFIRVHYLKKLTLDFEKEMGLVLRFFRDQRVGLERRLADQGAFVLEVDGEIQSGILIVFKTHRERSEEKLVELKDRFDDEVGGLLETVARRFAGQMRGKLDDWMNLHWASLRCAGRKNGQHVTARGYSIDFNGVLAGLCVEALNSSWIAYRERLRKLLYDDLKFHFIPSLDKVLAQCKGHDTARQELIESTYEEVAVGARAEIDLQIEKFEEDETEFDALLPTLTVGMREFLSPTYLGIAAEAGRGSAARMRAHLHEGVLSSAGEIQAMVKRVVKANWEGLTDTLEAHLTEFFGNIETQFMQQGQKLREIADHPSENDEQRVDELKNIESLILSWNVVARIRQGEAA